MSSEILEQGFDLNRSHKLLTAENYTFVFSDAKRFGNKSLTVLARPNNIGHPRLGLAISKKSAKRAVDRNRIKKSFSGKFPITSAYSP